jgi:rfaE bifunctional protein kinase chain/domain
VRGGDRAGHKLENLLEESGIESEMIVDHKLETTIKTRVIAQHQQLVRIDFENSPTHEILDKTLGRFSDLVADADVIVFSDYGKGGLQHISQMIRQAKSMNKCVLVDPKGSDYEKYRGASYITPNKSELMSVLGQWSTEEELSVKVSALRERLDLKGVLLTRSEEGMSLYQKGSVNHFSTAAKEIYDVSGAGDTVIGILAVMLGINYDIEHAVISANRAAGIVVGKLGTATTSFDELFFEDGK